MFWTNHREPADAAGHYLKEQLRARLRVAADFATLGAYELTAPEGDRESAGSPVEPPHGELERPQRVFLFAKAAAPCPASREVERPRCAVDAGARRVAKDRPARRRGGVRAPEQPCICSSPAKHPA
jgi:hypothetical protein